MITAGQRIQSVSAFTVNGMLEAAEAWRLAQERFSGQGQDRPSHPQTTALVFNTQTPLRSYPAGTVFGLKKPFFDPDAGDAASASMRGAVCMEIQAPKADNNLLCVLAEPMRELARIGAHAVIAGVVCVKVNRTAGTHRFAKMIDDDFDKLASADEGPVEILTTEDYVGERLEYVRFGSPGGGGGDPPRYVYVRSMAGGVATVSDVIRLLNPALNPNWKAEAETAQVFYLVGDNPAP